MPDIDSFEICAHPKDWSALTHDLRTVQYRPQLQRLVQQRSITCNTITDRYRAIDNPQLKYMHILPICVADVYVKIDTVSVYAAQPDRIKNILENAQEKTTEGDLDYLGIRILKCDTLKLQKDELDRQMPYNRVFSAACTSATTHICRVYISENQHTIVVLTNCVSNKMVQRLVAAIPAMAPWIPEKSADFPIAMYQALGKDNAREYYTAFTTWQDKVIAPYFREQERLNRAKYVKSLYTVNLDAMQKTVTQHKNMIKDAEDRLATQYATLRELQLKIAGLQNLPQATPSDIDYFTKHRRITFIDNASAYNNATNQIRFGISTPCINYDKELLASFINSPRGNDYNQSYKQIYTELFLKDRYVLWLRYNIVWMRPTTDANWKLVTDNNVSTGDGAGASDIGLLNPHLYYFHCYGQNAGYINKALAEQDYILALEQSIACVGTLNFADGIVMSRLHMQLSQNNDRLCVQDTETGEFLTLKQFKERIQEDEAD